EGAARLLKWSEAAGRWLFGAGESGKEKINYRIAVCVGESECNAAQCFPVLAQSEGNGKRWKWGYPLTTKKSSRGDEGGVGFEAAQGRRGRETKFLDATMDAFNHVCLVALVSRFSLLHNWVPLRGSLH